MILRSGRLSTSNAEYSVVVLPDPVGPVTRKMPLGRLMIRLKIARLSSSKPRFTRPILTESGRRIRRTIDSPWYAGHAETRKSTWVSSTMILMRPSCGTRFSAMFIPAMSLMRLSTEFCMRLGRLSRSMHTPSMRYRSRTRSAIGSMWMSLARIFTASTSMRVQSLTIGASSAATSMDLSTERSTDLSTDLSIDSVTSDWPAPTILMSSVSDFCGLPPGPVPAPPPLSLLSMYHLIWLLAASRGSSSVFNRKRSRSCVSMSVGS